MQNRSSVSVPALPVSSQDEILTVKEVASLLKCSPGSIYEMSRSRLQRRHEIPFPRLKTPFGLRFRRSDVMAWLEKVAQAGRAA